MRTHNHKSIRSLMQEPQKYTPPNMYNPTKVIYKPDIKTCLR